MIIWIASYPKSGNTWIRSLLSSYFFSEKGTFDFDLLNNIKQFSSSNMSQKINNNINYQAIISENWIPAQKIINKDKKIHFFKTHNAMCAINGNNFTDKFNTIGSVYIVRDPRNIVTSIANHYEISLDEAFNFLSNKRKIIFPINSEKKDDSIDFNFLSDWSTHYKSWKNINFCPIKIIKYEDLSNNTEEVFISLLNFLSKFIKFTIDNNKIKSAINSTMFDKLRHLENSKGFIESVPASKTNKKIKFFNLGQKNNWKKILDKKIAIKLENHFKDDMTELGYL